MMCILARLKEANTGFGVCGRYNSKPTVHRRHDNRFVTVGIHPGQNVTVLWSSPKAAGYFSLDRIL